MNQYVIRILSSEYWTKKLKATNIKRVGIAKPKKKLTVTMFISKAYFFSIGKTGGTFGFLHRQHLNTEIFIPVMM